MYFYLLKNIVRLVLRCNGTICEDTKWIRRNTRVIAIYWNIPRFLVVFGLLDVKFYMYFLLTAVCPFSFVHYVLCSLVSSNSSWSYQTKSQKKRNVSRFNTAERNHQFDNIMHHVNIQT